MSGGVWLVSGGVWMMSKGIWVCINTKSIGNNLYKVMILSYCLFFQCPLIRKKNASVWGCLDGVWGCQEGVWRCLEGVWGTLDTVWGVIMPNQLIKFQ